MSSCELITGEDLNASEERKRALYAAFKSHDTRFDGQVFVGVSSTKIYCRPVCSAIMPKYENCTFFRTATEAEAAGFRPCLKCRPETAPGTSSADARTNLARRAAKVLREECADGANLDQLAARLGYTDRHLRRIFVEEFSVTPTQYLQTCRLLLAKSLLTDTNLPVTQVAKAAGFGSVRRLNHLFKERYKLTPTDLRKNERRQIDSDIITVHLGYRPPYRFDRLLSFFRMRALAQVELIDDTSYMRTVRLPYSENDVATGWLKVEDNPKKNALKVTLSESLLPVFSQVLARVRKQFDLDCDPQAIYECLESLEKVAPKADILGTRLPGCFDPFETICRAILGQQISVSAANKLAARIVETYGDHIDTGVEGLTRAFPSPAKMLTLEPLTEALGPLGVIRSRSFAIDAIAHLIEKEEKDDSLDFSAAALVDEQVQRLLSIKGIGPWTADYIAMRVFSYPDSFLTTDAGVKHALPNREPKELLALAEPWRPWRSYATVALWDSLDESNT